MRHQHDVSPDRIHPDGGVGSAIDEIGSNASEVEVNGDTCVQFIGYRRQVRGETAGWQSSFCTVCQQDACSRHRRGPRSAGNRMTSWWRQATASSERTRALARERRRVRFAEVLSLRQDLLVVTLPWRRSAEVDETGRSGSALADADTVPCR